MTISYVNWSKRTKYRFKNGYIYKEYLLFFFYSQREVANFLQKRADAIITCRRSDTATSDGSVLVG